MNPNCQQASLGESPGSTSHNTLSNVPTSALPSVLVTPSKAKLPSLPTPMSNSTTQDDESPPLTPSTSTLAPLITPRRIGNIFAHAQVLLSTNTNLPVTGRDEQRTTLNAYLAARFPSAFQNVGDGQHPETSQDVQLTSSASLYVSGPPGIGKTALVSSVLEIFQRQVEDRHLDDIIKVHVENCSSLTLLDDRGSSIWERLGTGLGIDMDLGSGKTKKTGRQAFEAGLQNGCSHLIVLDEIDHIQSSKTASISGDLLNALFALAHEHSNSLTLIGIANALDLTTKSIRLPGASTFGKGKGKAKANDQPQVLHFRAYSGPELESIIAQRLRRVASEYPLQDDRSAEGSERGGPTTSGPLPLVAESALKLCALKISARNGDVRAALEVVRRAIATVEAAEFRKRITGSQPSTPTKTIMPTSYFTRQPIVDPLSTLDATTAPRVTLPIMSASLKAAGFGVPIAVATSLADLNINSRLTLVSICIAISRQSRAGFETKGFDRVVGIKQAHDTYRELITKEGTLKPINLVEFQGAIGLLESVAFVQEPRSVISGNGGGGGSQRGSRRSPGKKSVTAASAEKQIALSSVPLDELVEALKIVPANSCEHGTGLSVGALQETLRISKSMLDDEERRVGFERKKHENEKRGNGRDAMAPREGFNGDGLDEPPKKKAKSWLGNRKSACNRTEAEDVATEDAEPNEEKENDHMVDNTVALTDA